MRSLNRVIFKQSMIVSLLGLIAQVFGFFSTALIARSFGASWQTDAWFLAYAIALIMVNIVTGAAKFVFVPVFVQTRVQNPERVPETVGMIVTAMLLMSAVSVPLVWALTAFGVMDIGSTPQMQDMVARLVVEMLPSIPFGIMGTIFAMIYQSYQRFVWSELVMALRPIMVILVMVAKPEWGIHTIAIGNNLGYFLSALTMGIILVRSTGLSLWPKWGFSPVIRDMAVMSLFPLLSLVPAQIEPIALRAICAKMAEGSISALNYADRLAVIPMLLIGKGFMSVILSHWSKCYAEDAMEEVGRSLNRALSMLFTAVCPIVAMLLVTRSHLVRFAFRRGEFTEQDVALTISIFMLLSVSIIPEYLKMLLTRVMVIRRDIRRMFVLGLLQVVIELTLAVALGLWLGYEVYGVGLAILLARTWQLLAALDVVRRLHVRIEWKRLLTGCVQVTLACGIMSVIAKLIQWYAHDFFVSVARWIKQLTGFGWVSELSTFLEVGVMMLAGGAVYVLALRVMKNNDLESLIGLRRKDKPQPQDA